MASILTDQQIKTLAIIVKEVKKEKLWNFFQKEALKFKGEIFNK